MIIPLIMHPAYSYDFPDQHRFPMAKFGLIQQRLKTLGLAHKGNSFRPGKINHNLLTLAHSEDYVARFINNTMSAKELRRLGLPWSEALVKRSLISPNGTLLTAILALSYGVACHQAGGTHHASYDTASGFCIFNDLAVASLALLRQERIGSILIFDCDVHQGDGTATILANEPHIFTCSVHCEKNFPARKASSDLDVDVPARCTDAPYLAAVQQAFNTALQRACPDFIFYDAGVDVYEHDPLGLINISLDAIRERDRWVLAQCRKHQIPVATVIGGGYDRDREALAVRHCIVTEAAFEVF